MNKTLIATLVAVIAIGSVVVYANAENRSAQSQQAVVSSSTDALSLSCGGGGCSSQKSECKKSEDKGSCSDECKKECKKSCDGKCGDKCKDQCKKDCKKECDKNKASSDN